MSDAKTGRALCWVCEKPIIASMLGYFVMDEGVPAGACKKHATHRYVARDGVIIEEKV